MSLIDLSQHTFKSPKLKRVVNDALVFFQSTPAYQLPPPERFGGGGVYALYYVGTFSLYQKLVHINTPNLIMSI